MRRLIEPTREFGDCLKALLQKKKVSASELARRMACKSRNTIFRILDGEGGHGARQAFYERLIGEDPLALDEQERAQLDQALEISRVGWSVFLSNRAMEGMLMQGGEAHRGSVRLSSAYDREDAKRVMQRMTSAKRVQAIITGCCDRAIFEMLRRNLYEGPVDARIEITHYVYTGPEEIVQNIAAIQPLLYCEFYNAYGLEPGTFSKERERVYRNNCVYVHMQQADGKWYDQQYLLVDHGVFEPMRRHASEEKNAFDEFFKLDTALTPPLKTDLARSQRLENYLDYVEACRLLEQNRAIYMIKPDVPLSYIHPDILVPCIYSEMQEIARDSGEALDAAAQALVRIHARRYENYFAKRKATHTVFSLAAMRKFARTGKQSDHFFACRAYTPQERVQILTHLKRQMDENSYFHVHFFKPDAEPSLMEVGLYEGVGVLMTKPHTHYDLTGDHAETIITQRAFGERYKEFYLQGLLETSVLDEQATLQAMDELIEIAKHA